MTGAMLVFLKVVRAVQRRHDSLLSISVERTYKLIRTVCEDLRVLILDWHLCLAMLTPALQWTHETRSGSSVNRLLMGLTIMHR